MRIRNSIVLTGAVFVSLALPGLADLTDNPSDFNSPSSSAGADLRGPVQPGDTVPFTNVNNPPPLYQQPKLDDSYINSGSSNNSSNNSAANNSQANNQGRPLYAQPQDATDNPATGPKKSKHQSSGSSPGVAGAALGVPDRAAKTSVGLTDRAAKQSVGLADRAAKTSVGVPVKVIKSLF